MPARSPAWDAEAAPQRDRLDQQLGDHARTVLLPPSPESQRRTAGQPAAAPAIPSANAPSPSLLTQPQPLHRHRHLPQPAQPQGPITDAHTAIDFLTGRCTGVVRSCAQPPHQTPLPLLNAASTSSQQPAHAPAPLSLASVALETMPLRPCLERQLDGLLDLVERVVSEGSSVSALVMGPKASGKTLVCAWSMRVCACLTARCAHQAQQVLDRAVNHIRLYVCAHGYSSSLLFYRHQSRVACTRGWAHDTPHVRAACGARSGAGMRPPQH